MSLNLIAETVEKAILVCMEAKERVALRMFMEGLTPQNGWSVGVFHESNPAAILYYPVHENGEIPTTRHDLGVRVSLEALVGNRPPRP